MVVCDTVEEALKVPQVVHIEAGQDMVIAYQVGDELPDHCKAE